MADLKAMSDAELAAAQADVSSRRHALKAEAMAVQTEMDRRAISRKLTELDPKGIVIGPLGIDSAEVMGTPSA
jgi:hypothetical protein